METQGVIDRIEGRLAVVEILGEFIDLPVRCLPDGANEGDLVTLEIRVRDRGKPTDRGPAKPEIIDL